MTTLKTLKTLQTHKFFRLCDLRNGKWCSQSHIACTCPSKLKRVTHINWVEVDLMDRRHKNMVNLLRMFIFGIAEPWARFRDITHDAIECHVYCTQCQTHTNINTKNGSSERQQIFTFDYSWFGKRFRCGQYMKQYEIKAKFDVESEHSFEMKFDADQNLSLADMEIFYEQILSGFNGKQYSLLNCNCKHFAQNYWQCLETVVGLKSDVNNVFVGPKNVHGLNGNTMVSTAALINNW